MKLPLIAMLSLVIAGCASVPTEGSTDKAGGGTVVLCHKGKKTMELPEEAVQAHLDHGDHLGPC